MAKSKMEIAWKAGARVPEGLKVDQVYRAIEAVRLNSDDEMLRREDIVSAAKSSRNVLHKWFIWDDSQAAHEFRLLEAGRLMRSISVVYADAPKSPARAYEIDRTRNPSRKKAYRPLSEILEDPESRADLLQRALGELLAVRRRYHGLQELSVVFRELDIVIENMKP